MATARHPVPTAHCLLPTAYCLLPASASEGIADHAHKKVLNHHVDGFGLGRRFTWHANRACTFTVKRASAESHQADGGGA